MKRIAVGDGLVSVSARGEAVGPGHGADKDITFAPVKARYVRLNVFKAERPININEFQIFGPERQPK